MSTLIRTSVYAKTGNYDERLVYEDWDMWLRISRHFKFSYCPRVSTRYRIVSTSLTRKVLWSRHSARFISDFLIAEKLLAVPDLTKKQRLMLRQRLVDCAHDLYNSNYAHARRYLWKALKISRDKYTIMTYLLTVCGISHSSFRRGQDYAKWRWSSIKAWFRHGNQ